MKDEAATVKDWILRYAEQSSEEEEEEEQKEDEGKGGGNKIANSIESEGKFDPVSPGVPRHYGQCYESCEDVRFFVSAVCVCRAVTPFPLFCPRAERPVPGVDRPAV